MTNDTSRKAGDYLQGLGNILTKVKQLKQLNEHFNKYIDASIGNYCYVTNLINGKLVILTATGSIATQLRFESVDLLRKFKDDSLLKEVKQIETKVRPALTPVKRIDKAKKVQRLSLDTAQMIEDIAESLGDERLKQALKKIAEYKE